MKSIGLRFCASSLRHISQYFNLFISAILLFYYEINKETSPLTFK
jgi:hypothetical protein